MTTMDAMRTSPSTWPGSGASLGFAVASTHLTGCSWMVWVCFYVFCSISRGLLAFYLRRLFAMQIAIANFGLKHFALNLCGVM